MSYIGTYYAIGSAWLLTVANYFVIGWYNGYYDAFYRPGFGIFIGLLFVFTGLGNVALAVMRWRTGEKGLGKALLENFGWVPLMVCLSCPVLSCPILSYPVLSCPILSSPVLS